MVHLAYILEEIARRVISERRLPNTIITLSTSNNAFRNYALLKFKCNTNNIQYIPCIISKEFCRVITSTSSCIINKLLKITSEKPITSNNWIRVFTLMKHLHNNDLLKVIIQGKDFYVGTGIILDDKFNIIFCIGIDREKYARSREFSYHYLVAKHLVGSNNNSLEYALVHKLPLGIPNLRYYTLCDFNYYNTITPLEKRNDRNDINTDIYDYLNNNIEELSNYFLKDESHTLY